MTRLFLTAAILYAAVPSLAAQQPTSDTGRVYAIHEVTERPRATNAPELMQALQTSYPAEGAGRSGQVEVAVVIGADGTVADARVVSSTDPVFDTASVSAVRVLRFTPASLDGHAVAVRVNLPIRWEPLPVPAAQPDSQGVYHAHEVDEPPMPRNVQHVRERMEQLYPPELRVMRQGGEVVLRLLVDEQGAVQDARVESSTSPALDPPSLAVGRELAFTPARTGGEAVRVWTTVPLLWETDVPGLPVAEAEADGDTTPTYELSSVTEPPRILNVTTLRRELERLYPPQLRDSRQHGRVQVRFRVGADGSVSRVTIVRSSHVDFNQATIQALRNVRFAPSRLSGRPVASWVELPIEWSVSFRSPYGDNP